jgi:hypothetical protein
MPTVDSLAMAESCNCSGDACVAFTFSAFCEEATQALRLQLLEFYGKVTWAWRTQVYRAS